MSKYVDVDTIKVAKFQNPLLGDEPNHDFYYRLGWNDAIDAVIEYSNEADVRANTYGSWVVDCDFPYIDTHCSQCGMVVRFNKFQKLDNYCKRCGAYMQERGED